MRLAPSVFLLSLLAATLEANGECIGDSCTDGSCAVRESSAVAAVGAEEEEPIAVSLMQLSGSIGMSLRASSSLKGDGVDVGMHGSTAPGQDRVHVAYTVNRNVFNATLRSMLTLGLHSSAPNLAIHMLVPPEDEEAAKTVKQCLLQKLKNVSDLRGGIPEVEIVAMWEMPFQLNYAYNEAIGAGGIASQGRLFLQEYLPDVSRIVYLDSDTLILRDLSELYGRQMNFPLAAALGAGGLPPANFVYFCAGDYMPWWFSWPSWNPPFNDGVLLMDLDTWRSENISASITHLVEKIPDEKAGDFGGLGDQNVLNIEFQGCRDGYDVLPQLWNTFMDTDMLGKQDIRDVVAHFIHDPKPWNMSNSSRGDFFTQFRPFWAAGGVTAVDDCAGFEL